MKKRIVAVLLSLTLSSAMLAEAGAAALPDVSAETQSSDMFTSDTVVDAGAGAEVGTDTNEGTDTDISVDTGTDDGTGSGGESGDIVDGGDLGDGSDISTDDTVTTPTPDAPGSSEDTEENNGTSGDIVTDDPITVTPEATVTPAPDASNGLVTPEATPTVTPTPAVQVMSEALETAAALYKNEEENKLNYNRWKYDEKQGKWKLEKLPKVQAAAANAAVSPQAVTAEVQTTDETAAQEFTVEDNTAPETADTTVQAAEAPEAAVPETQSEGTVSEVEVQTVQAQETAVTGTAVAAAATAPEYYTSKDGIVKITTLDANGNAIMTGEYAFDSNGYLLTGRQKVNGAEYYFLPADKAAVTNKNTPAGNKVTPYSSKMGQKQVNVKWLWDGGAFHNYGSDGRAENIAPNKIYKIGADSYYLLSGGKPFVGQKYIKESGKTQLYYFAAASNSSDIPGKMQKNKWISRVNKGKTQWLYFGSNGRYVKKGCGAYKLIPSRDILYVLDKNGYLVKNKVVKGANGYYYMSNKYGHAYRNKLVKYGKYRYYFVSDGRRATYRNRWVRLPGAGNRYYYFGSVRGRIQEKRGFQKITIGGKFIGWFYFSKAGNHYIDYFSGGRYFLPDGRMASGVCRVDGRYYFFERSSRNVCRGKMYKGTWIKYGGKYYYAASNGNLATNGWRTIRGSYYYFKSLKAVTNTNIKRGNVYGRLDSRGRFVTGMMVANAAKNKVRYMDPTTGRFLKNTSKVIDGKLYYFDSNGYKRTDLTSIYKGPYYLEVDKVNGVMTVYTNSRKTVPVKTIRVSVGNPTTLTKNGTFTVKRADRWQLLMGPSWGQYGSHVTGGIYIHSVASGLKNANNLPADEYLKLGSPASHGCIRCCVADAKWVWENCNGAKIHITDDIPYQSEECFKGPLGRNPITPLRGSGTFDPTDPIYS